MDDLNPFVFTRPVEPDDLIDREAETAQLIGLSEGGHATRLSAPRRYGKTSLLRRVGRDMERVGFNYVEVDFYGVFSQADVIARLAEGYTKLRSPLRRMAISAIRALHPRVSVGAGPVRLEARPSSTEQETQVLSGLLDLPLTLFERSGTRSLIAFDEFQALLAVDPGIDGLFRSRIQRHGDAASYIFAGSHPGLMEQLFGAQERPFFGQARPLLLEPLPDPELADYVATVFEHGDRDVAPVLPALLDLVRGHPQRAMLLSHHLWDETPRGGVATADHWRMALDSVFDEHGEAMQATWDALETKEQAVLAALSVGEEPLFSQATLARFNLSKGGAQHAREKLAHTGHLHRVDGEWQLVDPLLDEWIKRFEGEASTENGSTSGI